MAGSPQILNNIIIIDKSIYRESTYLEYWPAEAGSISERWQVWPAAGGLDSGVLARRRRARFLRSVSKCGPPQAGSILEYCLSHSGRPPQAGLNLYCDLLVTTEYSTALVIVPSSKESELMDE